MDGTIYWTFSKNVFYGNVISTQNMNTKTHLRIFIKSNGFIAKIVINILSLGSSLMDFSGQTEPSFLIKYGHQSNINARFCGYRDQSFSQLTQVAIVLAFFIVMQIMGLATDLQSL